MFSFKNIILFLVILLAAFKEVYTSCADADLTKIYDCYKTNVFDPYNLPMEPLAYIKYFLSVTNDVNNIKQICDVKKNLTSCLTDPVVQNCFNVNDFVKVKFINFSTDANAMVANYLQLDYACGSVNKLIIDKGQCALSIPQKCNTNNAHKNCVNEAAFINCTVQENRNQCGAPASCFAEKYLSLRTCYPLPNCGICSNIDYSKNPLNGICSDDANYNPGNNGNNGNNKGNNADIHLGLIFTFTTLLCSFVGWN